MCSSPPSPPRIAVIGAGPSGLSCLRAFSSLYPTKESLSERYEIVCFDKQSTWGGLWNFSWRTGLDEFGESVHNSMYRYIWSNGPKEGLELSDYTFEEHFGKIIPSYPPREVIWDYVQGRVHRMRDRKSWVLDVIRFQHVVRHVDWDESERMFRVMVCDLKRDKSLYTEKFHYVIVASGHFSTPSVPSFPGLEKFPGRILHSHDFRDAVEFKGKTIVIIGTSYSAEDVGSQCYKYGCKKIISCYRNKPMGYKWPACWEEKPILTHLEGNKAFFKDGSSFEGIDAIVFCTGYQHHFPFLSNDLRLVTSNRLWPLGLYKGVLWESNPRLFFVGMQDQYYTFNMFDLQGWVVRDFIRGTLRTPQGEEGKREMEKDSLNWREREEKMGAPCEQIVFQGEYCKYLMGMLEGGDFKKFDVDSINELFIKWKKDKEENIMAYRDIAFRSVMTGNMATAHHTPWLEAMDDSMECFLKEKNLD